MKTIEPPLGLEPAEVDQILIYADVLKSPAARIDRISEALLGRKYVEGWLGGGPELPEQFRVSLNAFDCVTFLEVSCFGARTHPRRVHFLDSPDSYENGMLIGFVAIIYD
jgi:hypothetical protein